MKNANAITKLARFYSGELANFNLTAKDFVSPIQFGSPIGKELDNSQLPGAGWVKQKTAETIARSLVIPCVIALNGNEDIKKKIFNDEKNPSPSPISCFALNWRLQQ